MRARKTRLSSVYLFVCTIMVSVISGFGLEPPSTARSIEQALEEAGENRAELERALNSVPGADLEFLIKSASQFDLVNLTSEHLVENVLAARKVRNATFLRGSVTDGMWREWVLPYRILEEDLDLWRKRLHDQLWPLVEDAEDSGVAATRILEWVWEIAEDGSSRATFGTSETRHKSPSQILASGEGACGELNLLYVACLRAVGIPARHCSVGWWYRRSNGHYFSEFWDSGKGEWKSWDASDDLATTAESPPERIHRGRWETLLTYAHPGVWRNRDLYGLNQWAEMMPVNASLGETIDLAFSIPSTQSFSITLQVWNLRTWRVAAAAASSPNDGIARLKLIKPHSMDEPILAVSSDREGKVIDIRLIHLRDCLGKPVVLEELDKENVIVFQSSGDQS